MRREVVQGNVHLSADFQIFECFKKELEIERVGMVEIVIARGRPVMLFFRENFIEGIHAQQCHPGYVELLHDVLRHGRLSARTSTADAYHERLLDLTGGVVPGRSTGCIDRVSAAKRNPFVAGTTRRTRAKPLELERRSGDRRRTPSVLLGRAKSDTTFEIHR